MFISFSLIQYWDFTLLVLMIVNLVVIPVDISFFHGTQSLGWLVFHSLFDTFFMMDLLLNFRTGIMPGNQGNRAH